MTCADSKFLPFFVLWITFNKTCLLFIGCAVHRNFLKNIRFIANSVSAIINGVFNRLMLKVKPPNSVEVIMG